MSGKFIDSGQRSGQGAKEARRIYKELERIYGELSRREAVM